MLEVELLDDWVLAESTLWFSLFPDPVATYQRDEPLPATRSVPRGGRGSGSRSPAAGPRQDGGTDARAGHPAAAGPVAVRHLDTPSAATARPQDSSSSTCRTRSAAIAWVAIPLALLGDRETLSLGQMRAFGLGYHDLEGDYLPDDQDTSCRFRWRASLRFHRSRAMAGRGGDSVPPPDHVTDRQDTTLRAAARAGGWPEDRRRLRPPAVRTAGDRVVPGHAAVTAAACASRARGPRTCGCSRWRGRCTRLRAGSGRSAAACRRSG